MIYSSPSQEIYAFRGANYNELCKTFPDYTDRRILCESHRCVPEIVEVARHLGGHDAAQMVSCLEPTGNNAKWYEANDYSQKLRTVINVVNMLRTENPSLSLSDFAILGRRNNDLVKIPNQLRIYGLNSIMVGSNSNLYKEECTLRLLDYLRIAVRDDETVLDNLFNYPHFGIFEEDMFKVRGAGFLKWKDLENVLADPDQHNSRVVRRARNLLSYRTASKNLYHSDMNDEEKFSKIVELTGIKKDLTNQMLMKDVRFINRVCDNFKFHHTFDNYFHYMEEQDYTEEDSDSTGINLCGYHMSKGREGDTVFLLEDANSTKVKSDQDMVIARNTAYVAATRAKKHLLITTETNNGFPQYFDFMKRQRERFRC